ncbi:MAG: HNH endonuclease [Verrucomicrobiota bacterium]|jgi:predicted restriction endonuclease|nr:HNH endonuclease [Verrucomicrobiota bacterium]
METTNTRKNWTDQELKLAFYLYCQLPFGKIDARNNQIQVLARFLGRSANAVAMKLVNFASLDPAIRNSGRKGLGNASVADKRIWDAFHSDWTSLSEECAFQFASIQPDEKQESDVGISYMGETRIITTMARIGQAFFRNSVMASYQNRCCMSGLSIHGLLVASHIVPWAAASELRLNPRNGLCLSAIHDKAFDRGLITVTADYSILVSGAIKRDNSKQGQLIAELEGRRIILPAKFLPEKNYLVWHNEHVFKG